MSQIFAGYDRIYLIGYRGAGKSTVGLRLAERLGWLFADSDDEVIATSGKSILDIFENDGEAAFRQLEKATIRQLSAKNNVVIATGGGVVLRPENCELISQTGFPIWLRAPAETLFERIQGDPGSAVRRPHLIAGGSIDEVRKLLPEREAHYQSIAKLIVDTGARSQDEVVSAILASC